MMDALLEMMQSSFLVWATADSKRQGFLGFKEFVFAMQLVSLAQEGHQISHDFLNVDFENIRPPVIEGLDTLIMRKKQSSKSSSLESNGSLKRLYLQKLKPLEVTYHFNDFVSPLLEELRYQLFAVVKHSGFRPTSGHYVCYIRSSPNMWHKMNDSRVTCVEEVVLSQEAYILLYAKQGIPWFSTAIEVQKPCADPGISDSSPKS
ncbi:hypothetical protein GOBAR_AA24429 [Gossypium barbadense]|uniref:USP domain-containing protein n=1 Tax=Gossypium barbadense TaxID=3634 RepID=A0A2P5WYT1_GOSBA|nr:hypothetical protein GOBAR_AA24429 [Gossypium barbadense]